MLLVFDSAGSRILNLACLPLKSSRPPVLVRSAGASAAKNQLTLSE
jgi:hypothetical protein